MARRAAIVFVFLCLIPQVVYSQEYARNYSTNPERSLLIGFELGAGLDLDVTSRSPYDTLHQRPVEAYSLGGFLFGVYCGFRFNEIIGLELGWQEQQHDAHDNWGDTAGYQLTHLALRLAWPLPTRQTPVLRIGPVVGGFSYGNADPWAEEDNRTIVLGGVASLLIEHEFSLGIVGVFKISYVPLYRFGMGYTLQLWREDCNGDGLCVDFLEDEKDFTEGELVQIFWISLGVQFEWTFR